MKGTTRAGPFFLPQQQLVEHANQATHRVIVVLHLLSARSSAPEHQIQRCRDQGRHLVHVNNLDVSPRLDKLTRERLRELSVPTP